MNPFLYVDAYKVNHYKMYPDNMTKLYSNFTPRKSRIGVIDQCTWEQESKGLLTTVFKDGKLIKKVSLEEIRNKLQNEK